MTDFNSSNSYDYFNPFLSAQIVTDDGHTYPLWTRGADGSAFAIPTGQDIGDLKALSFLQEITLETQLGFIPKITATLVPPYEDAVRLLDSTLVEFGTNRLQVRFGYARTGLEGQPLLSEVFEGLMLKPDVQIGQDVHVVLHGQGVGAWAASQQQASRTFTNMSRAEIIIQVCAEYGMVPNFDAVVSEPSNGLLRNDTITYQQGGHTNWFVIQEMCRQSRCWAYAKGTQKALDGTNLDVLWIQPRADMATKRPQVTLTMFQVDRGTLSGDLYPILSANTDSGALWLPGVQKLFLKEIDMQKKVAVTQIVDDAVVAATRTSRIGVEIGNSKYFPQANETTQVGMVPHSGDPANQTAVAQAHALFESLTALGGIPLEVETLGIPLIQPGETIAINGLGLKLDTQGPDNNTYTIFKVFHTLGLGGFTTRLSLVSNTQSIIAANLQTQGTGPSPTGGAPDNSGTTSDTVTAKPDS